MGVVGVPYRQKLQAAGAEGGVSWRLSAGELPPGLELDAEGVLKGNPRQAGEWRFAVTVRDAAGRRARREIRLLVRRAGEGEDALGVATEALASAVLGMEYRQDLAAAGGVPPLAWSIVSGTLPPGLRLEAARGIIYGLPLQGGNFQFTVGVRDSSGASAVGNLSLLVEEGEFRLVTAALPPAVLSEPYQLNLRAEGGVPPYSWRVLGDGLPPGLNLHPIRGLLQGTPAEAGDFSFVVRVRDSAGREAERSFQLKVLLETPPGGLYAGFAIVTAELAPATRGVPYGQALETTGGTAPFTWTVALGELPPSLFLRSTTGEIAGIPEKPGLSSLRILVSDREGLTAQADYQLLVNYELVRLYGLVPGNTDLVEVRVGERVEYLVGAVGGQEPYDFELVAGTLPDFLSLDDSSGLISGAVSENYASGRRFEFQVRVSDQAGSTITGQYKIDVLTAPTPTPSPRATEAMPSPTPLAAVTPLLTPTPEEGETTPVPTPAWADLSVTELSGAVNSEAAGLGWENPASGLGKVLVVRRHDRYPDGPGDGTVFDVGQREHFLDEGLENGRPCYYCVLACDSSGNPGPPSNANSILLIPAPVSLGGENDPFADEVISYAPLDPSSGGDPARALGAPSGVGSTMGSLHVVSLHALEDAGGSGPYGGEMVIKFDNLIRDVSGADFTVFENVFYLDGLENKRWMEPSVVYVSRNGEDWSLFPFNYFPTSDLSNPGNYLKGFAGVEPVFSNGVYPDPTNPAVSGGDQFDLADVGLDWIQYVRLRSTGDRWLTDPDGDEVRHTAEMGALSGTGASGFDLDGLCAIEP